MNESKEEKIEKDPIYTYGVYEKETTEDGYNITLLEKYGDEADEKKVDKWDSEKENTMANERAKAKADAKAREYSDARVKMLSKNKKKDINSGKVEYHVWRKTPTTFDRENNKNLENKEENVETLKSNMKRSKRIFKLLNNDVMGVIKNRFFTDEDDDDEKLLHDVNGDDEKIWKNETISKIIYKNSLTNKELTVIKYVLFKSNKNANEFFPEFLGHKEKTIVETRYAIFGSINDGGIHTYMALEGDGRSFIDFNKMDKKFAKKAALSKKDFIGFKKMKKSNILTKNKTHNIVAKPIGLRDYKYDKHYERVDGFVAAFKENHKPKNITVNLGVEYTSFSNFEDISNEIEEQHRLYTLGDEKVESIKTLKALNNMEIKVDKKTIKKLNEDMWEVIKNDSKKFDIVWPLWFSDTPSKYILFLKKLKPKEKKSSKNKYFYEPIVKYDAISRNIMDGLNIKNFNEINSYYLDAVFDNKDNVRIPLFNCLSYSTDKKETDSEKNILYNGDWYVIDNEMYEYINNRYVDVFEENKWNDSLPDWKKRKYIKENKSFGMKRIDEDIYNVQVSMDKNVLCLDKKFIHFKGSDKIEFADLFYNNTGVLVAVKDGSDSAGISHLVTQARATLNLLKWDYHLGEKTISEIHKQYEENELSASTQDDTVKKFKLKYDGKKFDKQIDTLILGIGSEKKFKDGKAPHIPFLGRLAIVELFENYDLLHGLNLKISHIKITNEPISIKKLQDVEIEDHLYIEDSEKLSHISKKNTKYKDVLCNIIEKLDKELFTSYDSLSNYELWEIEKSMNGVGPPYDMDEYKENLKKIKKELTENSLMKDDILDDEELKKIKGNAKKQESFKAVKTYKDILCKIRNKLKGIESVKFEVISNYELRKTGEFINLLEHVEEISKYKEELINIKNKLVNKSLMKDDILVYKKLKEIKDFKEEQDAFLVIKEYKDTMYKIWDLLWEQALKKDHDKSIDIIDKLIDAHNPKKQKK